VSGEVRARVIGCGNPAAGDDALGLIAVRTARARLPAGVEAVEAGVAVRLMDLLDDIDAVVIVDAVRSRDGRRPVGTLVRVEASSAGLSAELGGTMSSHGLSVADSIDLAATLGPLPHITFLGLEAGAMDPGAGLSPEVRAALPGLVDAVVREVAGA
jgi:hydrogenase maturation protease